MAKTQVIILRGKKQSGKSYACDFIQKNLRLKDGTEQAKIYSFATALKNFCIDVLAVPYDQVYGTDEQKNLPTHINWFSLPHTRSEIMDFRRACNAKHEHMMSGREVLQIFGTDICRRLYGDCWVYSTAKTISDERPKYALIADARFPNEIEFFNNIKNGPLADSFTDDPIVISLLRNPLHDNHYSEVALDGYDFSKFKRFHELDNSDMTIEEKNLWLGDVLDVELRDLVKNGDKSMDTFPANRDCTISSLISGSGNMTTYLDGMEKLYPNKGWNTQDQRSNDVN